MTNLTDRQRNELEYHRAHARENAVILSTPFSYEVLENPGQRWWNAYWAMFGYFKRSSVAGKRTLVVGCGFGEDALRLAKLGADVYAFDLSPESLDIARRLADREGLKITFEESPAEALSYADNFFDLCVARDILHHVDIPATIKEIQRVAKPNATLVVNEIYSHSITDRVRNSKLVANHLYPKMAKFIYGGKPYITEDERKLSELDVGRVKSILSKIETIDFYNFVVTRLVPDKFENTAKLDRLFLRVGKAAGPIVAGRILMTGKIKKA